MNSSLRSLFIVAGALAVAVLSGCQTAPKVQTEFDKSATFASAKTFAIRPIPQQIPGVDPGLILRVGPAATAAVRSSLTAKGYTEVSSAASADLAVLVHGKVVPKTEVIDWGYSPGYGAYGRGAGWYGGYAYGAYATNNVSVSQYNEGTLIVEVHDTKTHQMIWVGWVVANATSDKDEQAAKVGKGVTRILAEYPAVGAVPVTPVAK